MLDDWLSKSKWKDRLQRFATRHVGTRSANQLTLVGLVLGLASAGAIFLTRYFPDPRWSPQGTFTREDACLTLATALMIGSFFLDVLDGAVARSREPTAFGGVLDVFCDRTVEVAILGAIVATDPARLLWPGFLSVAAIVLCITIFLALGGVVKQEALSDTEKALYYTRGIMERGETEIFLVFLTVVPELRVHALWIFAGLVLVTALQRLYIATRLLRPKARSPAPSPGEQRSTAAHEPPELGE